MIGQTFPKVVNNEGYSSWNTPFLVICKKRSFEQGIMAGVSGLKIAPRALFHPKIIRIGAMAGTVNRNRKVNKNVV